MTELSLPDYSEYSIHKSLWAKILKKNLVVEILEAFEKSDERFLFDVVGFCKEYEITLSESDFKRIKKVENEFAKRFRYSKPRLIK